MKRLLLIATLLVCGQLSLFAQVDIAYLQQEWKCSGSESLALLAQNEGEKFSTSADLMEIIKNDLDHTSYIFDEGIYELYLTDDKDPMGERFIGTWKYLGVDEYLHLIDERGHTTTYRIDELTKNRMVLFNGNEDSGMVRTLVFYSTENSQ